MKNFNKVVDFIAGNMVLLTIIVTVFCLAKPEAVIPFAKVKIGSLSITNVLLMWLLCLVWEQLLKQTILNLYLKDLLRFWQE